MGRERETRGGRFVEDLVAGIGREDLKYPIPPPSLPPPSKATGDVLSAPECQSRDTPPIVASYWGVARDEGAVRLPKQPTSKDLRERCCLDILCIPSPSPQASPRACISLGSYLRSDLHAGITNYPKARHAKDGSHSPASPLLLTLLIAIHSIHCCFFVCQYNFSFQYFLLDSYH
ncbi:hypothetical protein E2C01_067408 [Portunus trituberculatus]|uniref:Uncharacterized protein n=1 Tax=Portunus trituberculatus TaxID=210409 RepID=A0A5B7HKX0_PORTR|nr:hypothetical protein [Portunus trituberculatus]